MAIDKKVIKLKDLPLINRVYSDMKLVTAISQGRQNYKIEAELIKGNKIESITGKMSTESGGRNAIYINFADGKVVPIYYFNGTDGNKGKEGFPGGIGPQGEPAQVPKNISYTKKLDIINSTKVHIIDDNGEVVDTELTDEEIQNWLKLPWSALRGKDMNEKLYSLNEIFINDDLYTKRFIDISYIYAEFDTSSENEKTKIYNSDTNSHIVYKKIWTYEDSELETYYIYNPITNTYDEVLVNLWQDIYLKDSSKEYYEATNSQLTDGSTLYYFDEKTNTYKEVEFLNTTHIVDDVEKSEYIGDKRFEWYSSHINQDFIVRYTVFNDTYLYKLKNVNELEISAYSTDDLVNYSKVFFVQNEENNWEVYNEDKTPVIDPNTGEVKVIDLSSTNPYYILTEDEEGNEVYAPITSLSTYLSRNDTRYYKVNADNSLTEVKSEDDINKKNYEKYIVENINGSVYTYKYFYPTTLYEGTANEQKFYSENDLVLEHGTITLYIKDEDRKYYSRTNELDSNGNYIYKEIPAISWIYAEFITNDEDEDVRLLNSFTKDEDDNSYTDTSDENYEKEYTHIPMNIIIPGNKVIYKKVSFGKYSILDFNEYNSSNDYYILPENPEYEKITAQQVRDNYLSEVYIKETDTDGNEIYSINRYGISDDEDYYILKYIKLTDSEEYLTNTTVDLVIGVPQLLPINIYPTNSTDRNLEIEYDNEYIKVFEDGSICAVDNSLSKISTDTDYKGTDMKVLYKDEDDNILLSANIHINLIIPINSLSLETNYNSDDFYSVDDLEGLLSVETNEEVEFRVNYLPNPSSYTNFEWNISGIDEIEVSEDTLSVKVVIPIQGEYTINVVSMDGFEASTTYRFNVVEPAKYIVIKDLDKVVKYYTDEEAEEYNRDHEEEINAGELEPIFSPSMTTDESKISIKEQYYVYDCLMGKDYYIDDIISIEPEDTTLKEFDLNSSDTDLATIVDVNRTIILEEAYTKEATQDDIDNNLATELGELISIPAVTMTESVQAIRTFAAGTCDITGRLVAYPDVRFVDKDYNDIITISDNKVTNDGSIRIKLNIKQAITEINIVPQTVLVNVGEEKLITAVITPSSGVNMKDFRWSVLPSDALELIPADSEDVTKMYIKGLVGGAAIVNAYAGDGSNVNTEYHPCQVKVTIPTKNIYLYKDENYKFNDIIYVGIGNTKNIAYEIEYQSKDTNSSNTENILWNSENPEIASVENGVVTGNSIGKTTIIGYAGDSTGVFGSIVVEVIRLNTSITFDFNSIEMEVDDTLVLTPKFGEVNGEQSSNQVVVWSSSDEEVAKVKSSGIVYALSTGEAEIIATTTDGTNLSASCKITVI